jgi:NAD(P)-dependent dehydrogenase (short-subunit alcohol dehydrogenase family)
LRGGALSSSHRFGGFGGRSTADDVVRALDLSGRCMVVTGANTGIGFETARALASAGARVVLACRNPDAGRAAVQRIQARHPHADARLARLDLASFASIRAFTDALAEPRVDVLVCNAGLFAARYRETEDGFESTVGVCHLGHFLLTLRLLPKLLAARGRVVMVSSESHRTPRRLDFEHLPHPERHYSTVVAYGQAKLCNALFANELQRRYGAQGLTGCGDERLLRRAPGSGVRGRSLLLELPAEAEQRRGERPGGRRAPLGAERALGGAASRRVATQPRGRRRKASGSRCAARSSSSSIVVTRP